eukprot:CAMPEP_0173425012 /NCGR_PEP_ID=MMETSP1357-20121228/4813_1 /TAXON_ID=77926 /ORGANISM="Hemiselmis rufescens, Strain PCC563" /LENGTH=609 /DNA_ID=CAMNT_0014388363 /DNA_START=732 /DNA_END=2558 /DNA_ORIENTATION=+
MVAEVGCEPTPDRWSTPALTQDRKTGILPKTIDDSRDPCNILHEGALNERCTASDGTGGVPRNHDKRIAGVGRRAGGKPREEDASVGGVGSRTPCNASSRAGDRSQDGGRVPHNHDKRQADVGRSVGGCPEGKLRKEDSSVGGGRGTDHDSLVAKPEGRGRQEEDEDCTAELRELVSVMLCEASEGALEEGEQALGVAHEGVAPSHTAEFSGLEGEMQCSRAECRAPKWGAKALGTALVSLVLGMAHEGGVPSHTAGRHEGNQVVAPRTAELRGPEGDMERRSSGAQLSNTERGEPEEGAQALEMAQEGGVPSHTAGRHEGNKVVAPRTAELRGPEGDMERRSSGAQRGSIEHSAPEEGAQALEMAHGGGVPSNPRGVVGSEGAMERHSSGAERRRADSSAPEEGVEALGAEGAVLSRPTLRDAGTQASGGTKQLRSVGTQTRGLQQSCAKPVELRLPVTRALQAERDRVTSEQQRRAQETWSFMRQLDAECRQADKLTDAEQKLAAGYRLGLSQTTEERALAEQLHAKQKAASEAQSKRFDLVTRARHLECVQRLERLEQPLQVEPPATAQPQPLQVKPSVRPQPQPQSQQQLPSSRQRELERLEHLQ